MRTLVENSFILSTHSITADLRHAREQKTGINGFINISHGNIESVADYSIEIGSEHDYLVIQYGEEEQRIKLTESELYFGPRSWFICHCGRRVSNLYLPTHAIEFKCRRCYKLVYELTTFSRNSKLGQLKYKTNRIIKLSNTREQIRSIFYDNHYTTRFSRFLALSERAGFKNVGEDARELLLALK